MIDGTKPTLDDQYDRAEKFFREKRFEEATAILRSLAGVGYPPAFYLLGHYEYYHRQQTEALPWLEKLEAAANDGDADACLLCYHAYRRGFALGEFERDGPIGSAYLRRAAEMGNEAAQWLLADEHRSGANGQVKDEQLYLYWVEKAIASGNEDAIYFHAKWLAGKGRAVPESILKALEDVAQDFPKAARLLERLRRRNKP